MVGRKKKKFGGRLGGGGGGAKGKPGGGGRVADLSFPLVFFCRSFASQLFCCPFQWVTWPGWNCVVGGGWRTAAMPAGVPAWGGNRGGRLGGWFIFNFFKFGGKRGGGDQAGYNFGVQPTQEDVVRVLGVGVF